MARLLIIISLVLVLLLFPPAALALISNNAVPGDTTYPIKRSLENIIYSVVSINSVSKAWFSSARSDRRFQEVDVLLSSGKQATQTLDELVEQTQSTADWINRISDQNQKTQLINDLSKSIEKYDAGLEKLSTPKPSQATTHPIVQPTLRPITRPTIQPTTRPTTQSTPIGIPRSTSTPRPTIIPTSTPTHRPTPSPTPFPGEEQSPCNRITNDIQRARCELRGIQNGLHANSARMPEDTVTPHRNTGHNNENRVNSSGGR